MGMRLLLCAMLVVPSHGMHITCGRRRTDVLIRAIRAREVIASAPRETVTGADEYEHAKEYEPDSD